MIKYLRIYAIDPYEIGLQGLLINLDTDVIEDGKIVIYNDFKEVTVSPIQEYCQLKDRIFAKVVDNGKYELLDENRTVIESVQGYVPDWVDKRWNQNKGFGDYIDFKVDINCKLQTNMNADQLTNLLVASLISADSNLTKEDRLKNIGRLCILRKRFSEKGDKEKYLKYIDDGINLLIDEYNDK